jgi:4-hydroxy-3-polyprenylbenzoate decarboxylase
MKKRIVIALSAASGAGYGFELLRALDISRKESGLIVDLIYSDNALNIMEKERGVKKEDLEKMVDEMVHNSVMDHSLASGSNTFDALVICPCSTSSASKIHSGIGDNLTTRSASVCLKEGRKLLIVVRETPLSTPVLRSLYELSIWGVIVMPAAPPFYGMKNPTGEDLQRSLAGRILDQLDIANDLTPRYKEEG